MVYPSRQRMLVKRVHAEWLVVVRVCVEWVILKTSVYMGNGWFSSSLRETNTFLL